MPAFLKIADGSTIKAEPIMFEEMSAQDFCASDIYFERTDVEAEIRDRLPPTTGPAAANEFGLALLPNGEESQRAKVPECTIAPAESEAALGDPDPSPTVPDDFAPPLIPAPSPVVTPDDPPAPEKTTGPGAPAIRGNRYRLAAMFVLTHLAQGESSAVELRRETDAFLEKAYPNESERRSKFIYGEDAKNDIAYETHRMWRELVARDERISKDR